jgi:ABC-type nickel/cobalt efflux system permease component RcnA
VPRSSHDRTIDVRLTTDGKTSQPVVVVHYRLEADEFTVVFEDLRAVEDKIDFQKVQGEQLYDAFTRLYAPILAANLEAKIDGRELKFDCLQRGYRLKDEKGEPLGHLRCDFVFQAPMFADAAELTQRTVEYHFTFHEGNYHLQEGLIRLSLNGEAPLELLSKTEPDAALKARPAVELGPGDDQKLRTAAATFKISGTKEPETPSTSAPAEVPSEGAGPSSLGELLDSRQGILLLLLLAAFFGAAHALTPGHGKTLVAAYLIGERGTVGHAFVLGLVTTLTHTGAVFALAFLLRYVFPSNVQHEVQLVLGLVGGLLIAALGFWLLLRRLSGGADHFHIGGHHHHHHHGDYHHHHHGHADHYHDDHGHVHPLPDPGKSVGWWGLIVLGINGGIVPCWDAIVMLGVAIATDHIWLGIPLLLAFSAGLASVLILIGIGVVYFKGFVSSHWGESRLIKALPLISAALVTAMGLWLCYESIRTSPPDQGVSTRSQ